MRFQRLIAITITVVMLVSMMPVLLPASGQLSLPSRILSSADPYPNSDWLIVWQRPNGTDPNHLSQMNEYFYGEGLITPSMTMEYYGTDTLQLNCPSDQAIADGLAYFNHTLSYSWAQIADPELFPADCKLLVAFRNLAEAAEVGQHAGNDSRIIGAWIDDFSTGSIAPAAMEAFSDALDDNAGRHIPLFAMIYDDSENGEPYWRQSPYTWASLAPYMDGVILSCLNRVWDPNYYHSYAWYDSVKDLADILGTEEKIYCHLYNHHYNKGTYSWEQYLQFLKATSRLYLEGVIEGVSMLEAFWTQHNPLASNYLRSVFNTEFQTPGYESIVNLAAGSVTSSLNGEEIEDIVTDLTTLWENNYTFYSRHTQTVKMSGISGNNVWIRNCLTGDIIELTVQTPYWEFVAAFGEKYQVYSFPHSYVHYTADHYIETETWWDNMKIDFDGYLYINESLHITNSVLRFNHNNYDDCLENHTVPRTGLIVNTTGNWTLELDNTTIEPIHRRFTYLVDLGHSFVHDKKHFTIRNSTLACFSGTPKLHGYVWVADSLFFGHSWADDPGAKDGVYDMYLNGQSNYWYRNTINVGGARYNTAALSSYAAGGYAAGTWRSDGNIIIGGKYGLTFSMDYGSGAAYMTNTQIYNGEYDDLMDGYGENAWPESYGYDPWRDEYTRLSFPEGDTGWSGRIAYINTLFQMTSPVSVSGTLRNAREEVINTYTGTSIVEPNLTEAYRNSAGTVLVNPFPWTFEITSDMPEGYYYGFRSHDTYGINRSMLDPYFLPITDGRVTIWPEDSANLEIVRIPKQAYLGLNMTVYDGSLIDGKDCLYPWSAENYDFVPYRIPLNISGEGAVSLNVSYWQTNSSSIVAKWTLCADTDTTVTVQVSGLEPNTSFDLLLDGSYKRSCSSDANGTLTFELEVSSDLTEYTLEYGYMNAIYGLFTVVIILSLVAAVCVIAVALKRH